MPKFYRFSDLLSIPLGEFLGDCLQWRSVTERGKQDSLGKLLDFFSHLTYSESTLVLPSEFLRRRSDKRVWGPPLALNTGGPMATWQRENSTIRAIRIAKTIDAELSRVAEELGTSRNALILQGIEQILKNQQQGATAS